MARGGAEDDGGEQPWEKVERELRDYIGDSYEKWMEQAITSTAAIGELSVELVEIAGDNHPDWLSKWLKEGSKSVETKQAQKRHRINTEGFSFGKHEQKSEAGDSVAAVEPAFVAAAKTVKRL